MVTTFVLCLSQIILMYVFRQFSPRPLTLLVPLNLNVTHCTTWFEQLTEPHKYINVGDNTVIWWVTINRVTPIRAKPFDTTKILIFSLGKPTFCCKVLLMNSILGIYLPYFSFVVHLDMKKRLLPFWPEVVWRISSDAFARGPFKNKAQSLIVLTLVMPKSDLYWCTAFHINLFIPKQFRGFR